MDANEKIHVYKPSHVTKAESSCYEAIINVTRKQLCHKEFTDVEKLLSKQYKVAK